MQCQIYNNCNDILYHSITIWQTLHSDVSWIVERCYSMSFVLLASLASAGSTLVVLAILVKLLDSRLDKCRTHVTLDEIWPL